MRTSEGQAYFQELTQALRELQLAQDRVNEVIGRIRDNENDIENVRNQGADTNQQTARLPIARVIEDNEAIPGTTLRVDDRIRILNPNRNQENTGTITGYRDTYVYTWIIVTPRLGRPIKRIAKNLRRIKGATPCNNRLSITVFN